MKEETPALTQPPAAADAAAPRTGDQASADPRPADLSPPAPPARGGSPGLAIVLAVVALLGAAAAGWQAWQTRSQAGELRDELASRLAAADTAATEARALTRQQQEAIGTLQGKLGALESKVAATEGQAAALEALYQEFSRSREDRVIAEVEQAVTIAGQQLTLAGNVEAALIALQGAEARLATQDRGQIAPLRRAIARDIEQLRAMPQVDVQGIALRLEIMQDRIETLPLAYAGELPRPAEATDAVSEPASFGSAPLDFVAMLGRDLWNELKTLVRVERLDQTEPVLLAPAQGTFLRENVKIRLLTARLALLARDGNNYAADLKQARGWIERFFDLRDEGVQALVAELKTLEATPVVVEHGVTLDSMAALRLLQARPAGGADAEPAGPADDGQDAGGAAAPAR
ncbi:uroporphyrinogen-III C-methyltransferase [Pseudothauera rhizosphaerae]|uniref:Uroporphyrin-3 C-methyltransferase n=1 Tax=Pseudothauera rhizosphaerae TaxID=2565932 RepID=A0A4S4AWK2_9RHOO|nr:uroporphyrinogen-III C-methyltransferase [Pseudothauera rhizosphaerae]THF64422.1 hypothetical protein E6O51_03700 [Pseudothauera rhizosphaerae]